jgi:hypothetical membrane protein
MALTLRRAVDWLGVVGLAVSTLGIAVAIALAPWFSPTSNALSDLGEIGRRSAPAFNYGLIAGGVLGVGFAARLVTHASGTIERSGVALLAAALASMALIGVFPIPHPNHLAVSVAFFSLFTYALFVLGSAEVLAGGVRAGLGAIWLGIAHVTGWVVWTAAGTEGIAIPETVGALALAVWIVARTRRLLDSSSG